MLTTLRKSACLGLAAAALVSLVAGPALGQSPGQPLFPGFPGSTTPGAPGSPGLPGGAYTPFNPLQGAVNPSSGYNAGYNPYNPYYPPYYYQMDPVSSYLYGSSAVIGQTGQYLMNRESAQIYHQIALQKQLETAKMVFDLNRYIDENTPTFSDVQRKIAKQTLKRILDNAAPGEVWSGKALNILLKDLKLYDLEKLPINADVLEEPVLRQLNITFADKGSLGILKDEGRFIWPIALLDDDLVPPKQRLAMQSQAEALVKKALGGVRDVNAYKDLQANISDIREKLQAKVLTIPTPEYMQAKRFLENFEEAVRALESPNVAQAYLDYQKFIKKSRSVIELVNYMRTRGLDFAPASPGDEAGYQAVYNSLARLDMVFNTQLVSGKKQP